MLFFFGGGLHEGIIAGIIGFLMYFFVWINEILGINSLMRTTLTSVFNYLSDFVLSFSFDL